MANKKNPIRDDEGGKFDPARAARVKETRDRLSKGDDGGPISLNDGGKFYDESQPVPPAVVKQMWREEAAAPNPSASQASMRAPGLPAIPPGEAANQPAQPQGGGLIEAILRGLGLRGRK